MSIDILAREISITFLEPVTPQNAMDVTEGETSIGLARTESATSVAKTRPPGEEANNRNSQQSL